VTGRNERVSYVFDNLARMDDSAYGIGEGPATRVSLSLPEGTADAIRQRVGRREFSAFIAAAVERELRGQILDEYLADYERRKGPLSPEAQERAERIFDEAFAEEGQWPAAS
jgi:hypothetical protein